MVPQDWRVVTEIPIDICGVVYTISISDKPILCDGQNMLYMFDAASRTLKLASDVAPPARPEVVLVAIRQLWLHHFNNKKPFDDAFADIMSFGVMARAVFRWLKNIGGERTLIEMQPASKAKKSKTNRAKAPGIADFVPSPN